MIRPPLTSDERAQSETLGYILIFSIVSISIGVLLVTGTGSLTDLRENTQVDNGERAMLILAESAQDIHQRDAPSRAVEVQLADSSLSIGQQSKIKISAEPTGGGSLQNVYPGGSGFQTSSRIIFGMETGDVVYEWGSVGRRDRSGGTMIQRPPFSFGTDGTTISLVRVGGSESLGSSGSSILVILDNLGSRFVDYRNYGTTRTITVEVETTPELADAWKRYFEEVKRANGNPSGWQVEHASLSPTEVRFVVETETLVVRESVIKGTLES